MGKKVIYCIKKDLHNGGLLLFYITTASASKAAITMPRTRRNFQMCFTNLSYGIRPNVRAPISTPLVGVIRFTRPLADWNAVTAMSRPTPTKSESGAIIGMESVARPLDDGTKKDSGI